MARILAPNEQYNGVSAGVRFHDGVGETDDPYIQEWFKNHGYLIEATGKPPKKPAKKAGE